MYNYIFLHINGFIYIYIYVFVNVYMYYSLSIHHHSVSAKRLGARERCRKARSGNVHTTVARFRFVEIRPVRGREDNNNIY